MMLCLQLSTAQKWFCLTVSASIYRKSTLVPVILDVINIRDSCPKSDQIQSKNPAGGGLGRICQKGPDAGPAGAGAEIRYIPSYRSYNRHKTAAAVIN